MTSTRRVVALEPYQANGRALWKGGDKVWQVVGRVDREAGMDALEKAAAAVHESKAVQVAESPGN